MAILVRKRLDDVVGDPLVEVPQYLDQRPCDARGVRRRERLVHRHHVVRARHRSFLLAATAAAADGGFGGASQTKTLTMQPEVGAPTRAERDMVTGRRRPRQEQMVSAAVQSHQGGIFGGTDDGGVDG